MAQKAIQVGLPDQDWFEIKRFLEGERSAFEQIFNQYKTLVINLAYRFVLDRSIAEDIAQNVFIKIYERKVKVNPGAKFSTWLYRVTVNSSLDYLRKKKFSPISLDEETEYEEGEGKILLDGFADPRALSPAQVLEKKGLELLIQNEIKKLPEKFRAPILLYQFQELSYREIGHILGITEKAVERRIYRAKEILRKKLSKYF